MFLSKIHIENFKGIQKADFSFSEHVNLIVGNNGTGKTSILEAIAVALGGFLAGVQGVDTIHFSKEEIRRETQLLGTGSSNILYQTPVKVDVNVLIDGENYFYSRQKKSVSSSRSTIEPREICKKAESMVADVKSILPVISYQSFSRISNQKKDKWVDPFSADFSRVVGYTDCLEEASNTKMLTNWCKKMDHISWQQGKEIVEYEVVKHAVAQFMQVMMDKENIQIFYDKRTEELMYVCDSERLPLRLLSSGFRTMLGMVLDIAYRMAILNPDLLDQIILSTPGIVLIDEIDMHLHPNWQWKIIKALQTTFPKVQFIATTHSPIIVASCKDENMIVLNPIDQFLDMPSEVSQGYTVKGWQVNDVLEQCMDSSSRDPETVEMLNHLTALAKKRLAHTISEEELERYYLLIRELNSILPQDDIGVEEAAYLSIDEMLRDSL